MSGEGKKAKFAKAFARQTTLVIARIKGTQSASSADLSRSYGLPIPDVKRILDAHGVRDDD